MCCHSQDLTLINLLRTWWQLSRRRLCLVVSTKAWMPSTFRRVFVFFSEPALSPGVMASKTSLRISVSSLTMETKQCRRRSLTPHPHPSTFNSSSWPALIQPPSRSLPGNQAGCSLALLGFQWHWYIPLWSCTCHLSYSWEIGTVSGDVSALPYPPRGPDHHRSSGSPQLYLLSSNLFLMLIPAGTF